MEGIKLGAYRSAVLHPGRQNQNPGGQDLHRSWIGVELSMYLQVRQKVVMLTMCRKPPVASRMELSQRERRDYACRTLALTTVVSKQRAARPIPVGDDRSRSPLCIGRQSASMGFSRCIIFCVCASFTHPGLLLFSHLIASDGVRGRSAMYVCMYECIERSRHTFRRPLLVLRPRPADVVSRRPLLCRHPLSPRSPCGSLSDCGECESNEGCSGRVGRECQCV